MAYLAFTEAIGIAVVVGIRHFDFVGEKNRKSTTVGKSEPAYCSARKHYRKKHENKKEKPTI